MRKDFTDFYNKHGNEIIKMRQSGMMVKDIASLYNMNPSSISGYLLRNNIRIRNQLTESDKIDIFNRYMDGETPKSIAKDFHVTYGRIPEIIRELGGVPRDRSSARRIYNINENYFDEIDSQNKAYIIGLLIADGSRSSKNYAVCISLQESDVGVLKRINYEIGNERPLKYYNLSDKNPNYSNQYALFFNSKHMCDELAKYGIVPQKDFCTYFPDSISECLYRHVIRGIMDGDGSICRTEYRCNITGNRILLEFLKDYIEDKLHIHMSIYEPHKKHGCSKETRCIQIAGRRQVKKYLDFLYDDADLYIERKYQLYKNMYCQNEAILSHAS